MNNVNITDLAAALDTDVVGVVAAWGAVLHLITHGKEEVVILGLAVELALVINCVQTDTQFDYIGH